MSLTAFVLRRVALAAAVLAVFSSLTFLFFAAKTQPLASHPLLPAYWDWVRGLFTGSSYHSLIGSGIDGFVPPSLWARVVPALGRTAALVGAALVLVVVFSLLVGLAAARRRGAAPDLILRTGTYVAWAVPPFLLGLLVQQVATTLSDSHGLGPFPIAGWPGSCPAAIGINSGTITPCPGAGHGATFALNVLRYITLPGLTLALGFIGLHGRYLRSALVEALDAPFITTARAKGLSERRVLVRHALRASLATFMGVMLSDFGAVFGAALAVDWVFQLQGLGTVFIRLFPTEGFAPIDTYLLQIMFMLTACFVLAFSLLGELATRWFDPRVRAEQT